MRIEQYEIDFPPQVVAYRSQTLFLKFADSERMWARIEAKSVLSEGGVSAA
jgi:hypothetical protein